MDFIEVTQEILNMELNAYDDCGCYLHKALSDFYKSELRSSISVGLCYVKVPTIGQVEVSTQLCQWQINAIDYQEGKMVTEPQPIIVVVDEYKEMIYIEGEFHNEKE